MLEFDKNQVGKLKLHYSAIARSCGVSPSYVRMILRGERNQKTKKAQEVVGKSLAILNFFEKVL